MKLKEWLKENAILCTDKLSILKLKDDNITLSEAKRKTLIPRIFTSKDTWQNLDFEMSCIYDKTEFNRIIFINNSEEKYISDIIKKEKELYNKRIGFGNSEIYNIIASYKLLGYTEYYANYKVTDTKKIDGTIRRKKEERFYKIKIDDFSDIALVLK